MHITMQFWQEIYLVLNGSWDRSRMYSDDTRDRNWSVCFTTLTNTKTLSYLLLEISLPIFNNYTRKIQLQHIPQRTSAVLLLHIRTWLITSTFSLFYLFLLQAISNAEWESLFVFGECKANAPAATAKWDSKVIHIWQSILPLKSLRVEVEEICIKRLKTNLQSFWITKCFYSTQRLCFIHPSANNLCSKGTLSTEIWQKLNNLQNSMLSMTSRGEKDGERKWQLKIPESLVATVYPEHSMPTQIEEQGP